MKITVEQEGYDTIIIDAEGVVMAFGRKDRARLLIRDVDPGFFAYSSIAIQKRVMETVLEESGEMVPDPCDEEASK